MKRKLILIPAVILICMLIALPVMALYTDCAYYSTVTVANTGATDYTDFRFIMGDGALTITAQTLINENYLQADADDVYLRSGDADMPVVAKNLTSNTAYWVGRIPSLPAQSTENAFLYINAPTVTTDQSWICDDGDTNYAPDDATLDILDLLTVSSDVYLHAVPAAESEIVSKEGVYELCVDAANWIFRVWQAGAPVVGGESNPSGVGAYTNLTPSAGANWDCVNEVAPLGAGADVDWVITADTTGLLDTYAITGLPPGSNITQIDVYFRVAPSNVPNFAYAQPVLYSPSTGLIYGTEIAINGAPATYENHNEIIAYTGGASDLQIGIRLRGVGGQTASCSQLYALINYTPPDAGHTVTTPITLTDQLVNIKGTYDSGAGQLRVYEGATMANAALAGNLFANNESVYVGLVDACDIDTTRIGDTAIAAPTWRMDLEYEADQINATTITDQSASTNDVTYSMAAMPGGVTVTMGSLVATGAQTDVSTTGETPDMIGNVSAPGGLYDDPTKSAVGSMFDDFFVTFANLSNTPVEFYWWGVYAVVLIAAVYFAYRYLQHLFIAGIAACGVNGLFWSMGVIPWWVILISIFVTIGLATMERSPSL